MCSLLRLFAHTYLCILIAGYSQNFLFLFRFPLLLLLFTTSLLFLLLHFYYDYGDWSSLVLFSDEGYLYMC